MESFKRPKIFLSQRSPSGGAVAVNTEVERALKAIFPGIPPILTGAPHLLERLYNIERRTDTSPWKALMIFEGIGDRQPSALSTAQLIEKFEEWMCKERDKVIPVLCINSFHTHAYSRESAYHAFERTHQDGPEEIRDLAVSRGWHHTFCEEPQLADELTRVLTAIRDGQLAQFR